MTAAAPDLSLADYHRHPALSSTGARRLLPPSTPARFRWLRDHPEPPTRDMILGTCVHTAVLEVGQDYEVVEGNRNATAVKQQIADAEARGLLVLKPDEAESVLGMADAVRAHPEAATLLSAEGRPEVPIFWTDTVTGVDCRGMIDYLPDGGTVLVDLKTTSDASPAALPKHFAKYGYPEQAAWYLQGAAHLGLAKFDAEFVWIFVEKSAPFNVAVCRLNPADLHYAYARADLAREIYRDCSEANEWPGYPQSIQTITLPPWTRRDHETYEEETW